MAIKLIGNYSKKLGLPGYSSHQFELAIEIEIGNPSEVQSVSANIYNTLQSAVDEQIQQVGFVPDENYGRDHIAPANPPVRPQHHLPPPQASQPANSGYNQQASPQGPQPDIPPAPQDVPWKCSEKQHATILGVARKCGLAVTDIDNLAQQRFGKGIAELNKMEASGVIAELMERAGVPQERGNSRGGYNRRPSAAYSGTNNRY